MEIEILQKIVSEVLGVDVSEVKPDTTFVEDLGADSLDIFQIVTAIEEKFEIHIDPKRVEVLKTVEDAVGLIKDCRKEQQ